MNKNDILENVRIAIRPIKEDEAATVPFKDLEAYFFIVNDNMKQTITKQALDTLELTLADLWRHGAKNLLEQAEVMPLGAILEEMTGEQHEEADDITYVVTTKDKLYGAGVFTILEQVAPSGEYYVIPSSVHEILLVPTSTGHMDDINAMIRQVNTTNVDECDYLSDHAYIFNSAEEVIA